MLRTLTYSLPDLKQAWLVLFLFVLGQLAASVLLGLILGIFQLQDTQNLTMPLSYALSYVFPLLYLYWKGLRRLNDPLKEGQPDYDDIRLDRPYLGGMRLWAFVPLVVLAMLAVIILLSCLPEGREMPEWFRQALSQIYGMKLVVSLLTMGVLAPLLEEFLFRGIILTGLSRRMDPWWAILWSSVLFGIAHLNPWQALPAFAMGCFFGWLYLRTGSFWTVVGLHSLNNVLAIAAAALFGVEEVTQENIQSVFGETAAYIMVAVSAIVLIVGIGLINKYIPAKNKSNNEKSDISD